MTTKTTRIAALVAVVLFGLPAAAAEHYVKIVSDYENLRFVYDPSTITIQPGDTVVWINEINEEHNVISYPGGIPQGETAFESPYLTEESEVYRRTFVTEGTYQYHCLPHLLMGMTGEVVVGRRSEPSELHEPTRAERLAYRAKLLEWFDEEDNLFQLRIENKSNRDG